ncbi:AAA family ATPase [Tsuneonella flava]|uniref:AAA family ATPase n=1 Tax=Tsuneonella flava TaxID=2055955 RepID=A0ABX7K727_9SPHN|nr:AAA family ATPase [Tsuneonella flava]QSB44049.1 AAA family ATPase [Tsuneonella flava]
MDRFFIVTGRPGSGKSTLLAALAEQGLPHMPEAGRAVIRDEVARVYQELGYVLVTLPLALPDERSTFVQHWIAKLQT